MNQSITRFGSFFGKVMAGVVPIAFQSQLIRIAWGAPRPSNSDHQKAFIFCRGSLETSTCQMIAFPHFGVCWDLQRWRQLNSLAVGICWKGKDFADLLVFQDL